MWIALIGLTAWGCVAGYSPTRPDDAPKGAQLVDIWLDDAANLIEHDGVHRPLLDVRIETVAGPLVGRVAVPSARAGDYQLWLPVGDYRIRLSSDGLEGYEADLGVGGKYGFNSVYFYMNRPPHTLMGSAYNLPPGTSVRILDGANAGRATTLDADHLYRLDGLLRSAPFRILFGSSHDIFANQQSGETVQDFVHHAWFDVPR